MLTEENCPDVTDTRYEQEEVLTDDYPVYYTFWYLVNGIPRSCGITGTVGEWRQLILKQKELPELPEIRRCNAVARKLPLS